MKNKYAIMSVVFATLLFGRVTLLKAELRPNEILVVANTFVKQSEGLARYYMEQRKIPPENLLLLRTTDNETIERGAYDAAIAGPVRRVLLNEPSFRCVVLMYGTPLRVAADTLNFSEEANLKFLHAKKERIECD